MTPPQRCTVIIEPEPQRGSWNMAVDEALLETTLETGECFLRWYRWDVATLSLGYFQSAAEIAPELVSLPAVRRLTGGGAIVHHHELTYCCTIPPSHELTRDPLVLYEQVHQQIIGVLRRHGAPAKLRGEERRLAGEPFLCFSRGDARDIVLEGTKVVGSAQRRRRGAVMQHGSLILERSPFARGLPGLRDLVPQSSWQAAMAEELAAAIAPILGAASRPSDLPETVRRLAESLESDRYRSLEWGATRAAET